jgi:cytochrome P450
MNNSYVTQKSVRLAMANEEKLQTSAHPIAYRGLKLITDVNDVVRIPKVGIIISETAAMREILTNPLFGKTGKGSSDELWTPLLGASALINMDGQAHGMLRRKISPLFTPKIIKELADKILDAPLAELAERIIHNEYIDLTVEASAIANLMICEIVGVSENPEEKQSIQEALSAITAFTGRVGLATKKFTAAEADEFKSYLDNLLISARKIWADENIVFTESSVISRLKSYDLTEEEMSGVICALIIAGTETIVSVIPRLIAICIDSGWFKELQQDRSLLPQIIEEGFRVTVPSPVMIRNTKEDGELVFNLNGKDRKVSFKKDERVILANIMACKKIGDFNPLRKMPESARKMWFGAGAHFCIGMPLAMVQIERFMETILDATADGSLEIIQREIRGKSLIPAYSQLIIKKTI